MKASILYYFLPPPTLIAPRTIKYRSPAFPAGRATSPNPLPSAPREFSFFVWHRPPRATTNFGKFLFLPCNPMAEKLRKHPPRSPFPCAPSLMTLSQWYGRLLVGCCVSPSRGSHPNWWHRHSLYFNFFRCSIQPPKTTSKRPPHIPPILVISPMPPPPRKPSFGWLLHWPIK